VKENKDSLSEVNYSYSGTAMFEMFRFTSTQIVYISCIYCIYLCGNMVNQSSSLRKQVIKVIWHQAAAHERFSDIRQVAPVCTLPTLPSAQTSPNRKRHLNRFSRFRTDHDRASLYFTMGGPFPLKIVPSHWGSGPPLIRGSLSHPSPHSISIGWAVFAEFTEVTDIQTDRHTGRPRYSVCNDRPHLHVRM